MTTEKLTLAKLRCKCKPEPGLPIKPMFGMILHGARTDSTGGRMAILIEHTKDSERGWLSLVYTATDSRWRLFRLSYIDELFWHRATDMVNYSVRLTIPEKTAILAEAKAIGASGEEVRKALTLASSLSRGTPTLDHRDPLVDAYASFAAEVKKSTDEAVKAAKIKKMIDTLAAKDAVEDAVDSITPKRKYTPRAKKTVVSSDEFKPSPPNPDSYWYESESDARLLKDFVALRLAGYTTNLMILGPSGFGKTQGVINFGNLQKVPVHVVNCQAITTPEKWLGQMNATPERGTFFDVAPHLQWVERVHDDCKDADYCILLYDEMTRLRPELANMQFSLLDDQQGLEVPQMGRRVKMHPRNVVIATANFGTPYSGVFQMDWALRGRFDLQLERGMPPAPEEIKVITTANPGISEEDAAAIVRVADNSRQLWQSGDLESPISTRSLNAWARLIAGGYTIKDAAEYTIYPLYSEDGDSESDRAKMKMAVDGKTGSTLTTPEKVF